MKRQLYLHAWEESHNSKGRKMCWSPWSIYIYHVIYIYMTLHGISGFGGTRVWGSRPSNGVGCTGRPENIQSICIDSPLTTTHTPFPSNNPSAETSRIPFTRSTTFSVLLCFTVSWIQKYLLILSFIARLTSWKGVEIKYLDRISSSKFDEGGGAFWRFYFYFVDWSYRVNEMGDIWLHIVSTDIENRSIHQW